MKSSPGKMWKWFFGFVIFGMWGLAFAQETSTESATPQFEIPAVEVRRVQKIYPEEPVVEKRIVSGKKVTTIDKAEQPSTPNNNYRQLLAEIPGLMISEVNNESWASLTYRGLGDPHESFNILTLRNGLPSVPDPYGYPAGYYVPPSDAIERVDFYRGGSGLLYGPQPGGALNFQLRRAPGETQATRFRTTNLGGSYGMFSTYNEVTTGNEQVGHLFSLHARGQDGFRETNNDTRILNPRWDLRWNLSEGSQVRLDLDMFQGRYGEPGGLARTPGANVITLDNPRQVTRRNDRLEIDRTAAVLSWDKSWSADSSSTLEYWYSEFRRESFRQDRGSSPAFGGVALNNSNVIQNQRFFTHGVQGRWQQNYILGGKLQHLTVALQATQTQSPFREEAGATATATDGVNRRDLDRETQTQALVVENAFRKDRWTFVPGVRVERIRQQLDENQKPTSTVGLREETQDITVALFGLGVEYQLVNQAQVYANISEGYKPPAFQDTVPLQTADDTVSEDLEEARTLSSEVGVRGPLGERHEYDVSVFRIDYSNLIARATSNTQNGGAARSEGVDFLVTSSWSPRWRTFASLSLLDAEFRQGRFSGNQTQYSPERVARAGVTYAYADQSMVRLQGQIVGEHYGDDANSANFELGEVATVDLTGQHHLSGWLEKGLTLNWGFQNLFDQDRPTRVRATGFEPAQPLTVYGGFTANF